jgi:hypothetical protein
MKAANGVLALAGLQLQRVQQDFDARVADPYLERRLHQSLAASFREFLASQALFDAVDADWELAVSEFYQAYLKSPFRGQTGGSRFNNLLWLCLIMRAYSPTLMVDVGAYLGASAWAMALGAPGVPLYSFDIDLSNLKLRVAAEYVESDWKDFVFTDDLSRAVCYLDDHVDQARRLLEAAAVGFPLAIFDDDFPLTSFAEMAHAGAALPKVEFVLDEDLRQQGEVAWLDHGVRRSWTVDRAYLDRARSVIEATARLPNTSLITGIHQTPYRLVRLGSSST